MKGGKAWERPTLELQQCNLDAKRLRVQVSAQTRPEAGGLRPWERPQPAFLVSSSPHARLVSQVRPDGHFQAAGPGRAQAADRPGVTSTGPRSLRGPHTSAPSQGRVR